MKRSISVQFVFVLLLMALPISALSCRSEAAAVITAVDDASRTVYIEQTPQRVVSLSPSITEILFAIGLGDKVVGITEHCDYPEAAKAKPKVGGYFTTSLEDILDKDPDLILTDGYDPVMQQIEGLGIPMLVLQPEDIDGIFKDIDLVGKVMNKEEEAARLVDSLQQRLDKVAEIKASATSSPTVFYEIDATDPTKPWTAGPGSFADILISLAGGSNIVTESGSWLQLSLEKLLSANPDIIILGDYPYVTPEQVEERSGVWQDLTAVNLGKVYAVSDPSLTSRPGPRIIDGLEEIARMIHPELFPS
ncbi:MAG: ABC transporter substrate-binding protein [Chloroflexi bacterium]|nr:ABC transporter substrate-binding protein [Chloroflexota bacterium]